MSNDNNASSNNTNNTTSNQTSQDSGQNIPSPSIDIPTNNPWRGETILKSDNGDRSQPWELTVKISSEEE